MKQTIKNTIMGLTAAFLLLFTVSLQLHTPVYAEDADASAAVCEAVGAVGTECSDSSSGIDGIIETALNILSLVAGIIAVIMIIVAGLKFITSQGDSGAVASARNSVIYAIVGIIIVVLAQVIARFVISESSNLTPPDESTNRLVEPQKT